MGFLETLKDAKENKLIFYDEIKKSKFIRIFRNDQQISGQTILTSKDLSPEIYKSNYYDLHLEIRADFFNVPIVNYTADHKRVADHLFDQYSDSGEDDVEGYFIRNLRNTISKRKPANFKYLLKPNELLAIIRFLQYRLVLNSTAMQNIFFGIPLKEAIPFLMYFKEGWQGPDKKCTVEKIINMTSDHYFLIATILIKICGKIFNIDESKTKINLFNVKFEDTEIYPDSGIMGKKFGPIGEVRTDCFETEILDFLGSFYFSNGQTKDYLNSLISNKESLNDIVESLLNRYNSMKKPLDNFYQLERFRV